MSTEAKGPAVGRPVAHESAAAHVTGHAKYTDDLVDQYRDVLHAWPVMAEVAHGLVKRLDVRAAEAMEGVAVVLTADHVAGDGNTGPAVRDEPLFPTEVQYHGQPICWVLADSEEQARAAAAAVEVEIEPLDAVVTIEQAIEKKSFLTEPGVIEQGSPDRVLSESSHKVEGEINIRGQEHFYLETQAALARVDGSGHVFVQSSTQHPSETQEICARVLGIPKSEVTCQSLRMGGAFGGKEVQANTFASIAALGAVITSRPVRVRLDRRTDFIVTGKRHPFLGRYRIGFDDEGRIQAAVFALYSNGGYSLDLSKPVMYRAMFHVDNAYHLPHARVTGQVCKTHLCSQTAFRGFGGPQGMLVVEEALDHIARKLGIDAATVRERNLYREGQRAHYGQPIKDAERIRDMWSTLHRSSELSARRVDVEKHNASHPHLKRGLAITPVKFGISFTTSHFNQAGALVLIYADGSVQVNHGGTEMGQGLHTKIQQIAADALGVPLSGIRIMPTQTDKVPNTSATAASSGTDLNGAAVRNACDALRERLADVAGRMLDCAPDDVAFVDGKVHHFARPETSKTFAEVTARAYLERVPLFQSGYYRTPKIAFDEAKGQGKPFHYYAFGAAVSEVEVDGFTGMWRLLRTDILHDCGTSISPKIDLGQVEGGFAQGLGWLTTEELVWDDAGVLRTVGASTYKLPSLGECPPDFRVELLPKAPEPTVVHGSKAVGEPPFMLAFSVREAIREAVAAFASGEVERITLACPSTPEAIYWAIERVRASAADAAAAQ